MWREFVPLQNEKQKTKELKFHYIMNLPLITWSCIVGLFAVIVLVRIVYHGYNSRVHHRLFEIGTEREEFYVPGDRMKTYNGEYDYSDEL